jgi:hypothetical protein
MIGALLVLTALAGSALYVEVPASGTTVRTFSAAFPRDQTNGPSTHGDTSDTQTGSAVVTINLTNLTSAAFSFNFKDNYRFAGVYPAGATFRVTSPEGNSSEVVLAPGGASSGSVQFPALNIPPEEMVFSAKDMNDAKAIAYAKNQTQETGSGDWTVEVSVQRNSPIVTGLGSISWNLATRVELYKLQVTELYLS